MDPPQHQTQLGTIPHRERHTPTGLPGKGLRIHLTLAPYLQRAKPCLTSCLPLAAPRKSLHGGWAYPPDELVWEGVPDPSVLRLPFLADPILLGMEVNCALKGAVHAQLCKEETWGILTSRKSLRTLYRPQG